MRMHLPGRMLLQQYSCYAGPFCCYLTKRGIIESTRFSNRGIKAVLVREESDDVNSVVNLSQTCRQMIRPRGIAGTDHLPAIACIARKGVSICERCRLA
jgi:hypothetical protein